MPNEFLDLLETVRSEDASTSRLFNSSDGRGIRSMRREDPRYQRSLAEANSLYSGVLSGKVPMHRLEEAMSTSDFPLLFADIIDREMLGRYAEWPSIWAKIARRGLVRDFRTVKRFKLDGAEGVLSQVGQGNEYPEASVTDGAYSYSVAKYGRRIPFLWEALVNDDLDALRDIPDRLAKAARMTEERFATEVYVDTTGPDATFFSGGNGNYVNGAGTVLSLATLQTAFGSVWSQKDADGNPIFTGQLRLVVPPQLAVLAKNILNATELRNSPGATSGDQIVTTNWVNGEVAEVVVNPWLPIVDTTSGATAWYLFADPGIGRPAMEVGFLRGHDTPELFMKSPNSIRVGGGVVGAEDGSFETDGVDYKVRHVVGGTLMEPKAAYASKGAA
jgi:hypothetical protein